MSKKGDAILFLMSFHGWQQEEVNSLPYLNTIGITVISEVERKIKFLKASRNFTVERVLITGSGITPGLQKNDYFHHILGIEDLFKLYN
jgi:hypothetical protein